MWLGQIFVSMVVTPWPKLATSEYPILYCILTFLDKRSFSWFSGFFGFHRYIESRCFVEANPALGVCFLAGWIEIVAMLHWGGCILCWLILWFFFFLREKFGQMISDSTNTQSRYRTSSARIEPDRWWSCCDAWDGGWYSPAWCMYICHAILMEYRINAVIILNLPFWPFFIIPWCLEQGRLKQARSSLW